MRLFIGAFSVAMIGAYRPHLANILEGQTPLTISAVLRAAAPCTVEVTGMRPPEAVVVVRPIGADFQVVAVEVDGDLYNLGVEEVTERD